MTQQKSDLHSVPNLLDKNLNQETKNFDLNQNFNVIFRKLFDFFVLLRVSVTTRDCQHDHAFSSKQKSNYNI